MHETSILWMPSLLQEFFKIHQEVDLHLFVLFSVLDCIITSYQMKSFKYQYDFSSWTLSNTFDTRDLLFSCYVIWSTGILKSVHYSWGLIQIDLSFNRTYLSHANSVWQVRFLLSLIQTERTVCTLLQINTR